MTQLEQGKTREHLIFLMRQSWQDSAGLRRGFFMEGDSDEAEAGSTGPGGAGRFGDEAMGEGKRGVGGSSTLRVRANRTKGGPEGGYSREGKRKQ